jgi:hypothetical protein
VGNWRSTGPDATGARLLLGATIYGEGAKPMNTEDMIEIERAGRRCTVCRTGRGWRHFEIVRAADRDPAVLCTSCHTRFGDDPPVKHQTKPAAQTPAAAAKPAPKPRAGEHRHETPPDRLRAALRELPGSFSTAMAARAAGLNQDRTLTRLEELERLGEVQRVGNRWSTEAPPSEVASAMDRLEARTTNLRIVRDRARVG